MVRAVRRLEDALLAAHRLEMTARAGAAAPPTEGAPSEAADRAAELQRALEALHGAFAADGALPPCAVLRAAVDAVDSGKNPDALLHAAFSSAAERNARAAGRAAAFAECHAALLAEGDKALGEDFAALQKRRA